LAFLILPKGTVKEFIDTHNVGNMTREEIRGGVKIAKGVADDENKKLEILLNNTKIQPRLVESGFTVIDGFKGNKRNIDECDMRCDRSIQDCSFCTARCANECTCRLSSSDIPPYYVDINDIMGIKDTGTQPIVGITYCVTVKCKDRSYKETEVAIYPDDYFGAMGKE
jgi:hypothetical protein